MRNPINALPVLKWHLSCVFRSEIKWGSFGKSSSAAAHFRNLKFRQNYTNSKLALISKIHIWFVLWFIHPDKKDLFILTSVKLATCVWGEQFLHFSIKRRSNNICALPPVPAAKVIEPCVKSKSVLLLLSLWEKFQFEGLRSDHFGALVATRNKNHCIAMHWC